MRTDAGSQLTEIRSRCWGDAPSSAEEAIRDTVNDHAEYLGPSRMVVASHPTRPFCAWGR